MSPFYPSEFQVLAGYILSLNDFSQDQFTAVNCTFVYSLPSFCFKKCNINFRLYEMLCSRCRSHVCTILITCLIQLILSLLSVAQQAVTVYIVHTLPGMFAEHPRLRVIEGD